ncbi:MAG: ABC transporter substrate-binding protein [bacterium]|nr:ABC transporter substrate-binding protein [bacterium]
MGKRRQRFQGSRILRMVLLFLCPLILAGCGGESDSKPSEEMTEEASGSVGLSEGTEEAPESAGSAEGTQEASEDASQSGQKESSGKFTFDGSKAYGQYVPPEEGEKIVLTLQDSFSSSWLENAVAAFNRKNDTYFIQLLQSGFGEELVTCRQRMSVEIVAGRGPDLFTGDVFAINETMIQKGYIENLAPKLEEWGITDEEYFPSIRAFTVGDGVYALCPYARAESYWISEELLGGREQPDIETLVNKLYEYPDQTAVWRQYGSATRMLEYLLMGSEDLWGMIDWEKGTCDFTGELFRKMLEVALRYQDPEGINENALSDWYDPDLYELEEMEKEGKVIVHFLFDDGGYPYYRRMHSLMINANSEYKDVAFEFLEYLLGPTGQNMVAAGAPGVAANKEMFESYEEWQIKMQEDGRMQTNFPMTETKVEVIRDYSERGRYTPTRTLPILSIIYEEADGYFTDGKSLEMVIGIIQNRVQVYLDEMI